MSSTPLTEAERAVILSRYQSGIPARQIAKEIGVNGQRVSGFLRSQTNFGVLSQKHAQAAGAPALPPPSLPEQTMGVPSSEPQPFAPVVPVAPPVPAQVAPAPQYAPVVPQRVVAPPPTPRAVQAPADGFAWKGVAGQNGGWSTQQSVVRYQVERKVPNDGIVGQHQGNFSEADLCQIYGEGIYRIVRYEPGKVPLETEVKVGSNWGPPKYPRQSGVGAESRGALARPWNRGGYGQPQEPQDPQDPGYQRQAVSFDREPNLYAFRRHEATAQDAASSVTTEAIRALSMANERAISQAEKARDAGPSSFLTDYMRSQQDRDQRRYEEERRLKAEERKEEEARAERRAKEREEDHRREMERLRIEGEARIKQMAEERRMIMDLEEKRVSVIREEHKIRQDALQQELALSRESSKNIQDRVLNDMKEIKDKTEEEIQEAKEALTADMQRQQEQIDREFKLKSEAYEREQKLQEKILEIRQEQLQQQNGNEVFNTINTLVKELSKGIEKVVELKKTQALAPEAQVAMVASGAEGNVHMREEAPAPDKAEMGKKPEAQEGALNMENLIRENMDHPFFKEVLREWALHVESETDPTAFASLFLEWMMDPNRHEVRQACSMFTSVMKVRNWKRMMGIMGPKLEPEVKLQFEKPFATDFYDAFKAMVLEHIRVYWANALQQRNAETQQAQAPQAAPAKPEIGPVPTKAKKEEKVEPEASEAGEEEAPAVPTRESLKRVS